MADRGKSKTIAEINITPLTDIFLVLLIIMMVVTPMLDFTGLSATLGGGETAEAAAPSDEKVLPVVITAEGPYRVAQDVLLDADGRSPAPGFSRCRAGVARCALGGGQGEPEGPHAPEPLP